MSNIQKQHKISPAIAWLTIQKFIIFYCPLDREHTRDTTIFLLLTVKDGIFRGKDIVHLNFIKIPVFHRHLEQIIVRQNYAALQMPAILNGKVPNALGYYQGVSVFIDLDALTATPPDILSEAGINGNNLYAKFCEQKGHIAMPASEKIEHIFSELYDLPERM